MKNIITLTTVFLITTFSYGYNIQIRIYGLEGSKIKFSRYFGEERVRIDSVILNENGYGILEGENKLPAGIYGFMTPQRRYFEVLVNDDDEFSLTTDTTDLFYHLQIDGSKESVMFLNHQKNIVKKQKLISMLNSVIKQMDPNDSGVNDLQNKVNQTNLEIQNLNDQFLFENKGTFAANVVNAILPVKIPKVEVPFGIPNRDSLIWIRSLQYYTLHYFDNIDLSDRRMLNTPLLHSKIDSYFNQVLFQTTDSIIAAADRILQKPEIDSLVKNYIVGYLLDNYNKIENLGFEDVLLHLSNNYMYENQELYLDYKTIDDVKFKISYLEKTVLGKKAPNLKLKNIAGGEISLRDVEANYTILVFWNPDCEHCVAEMKILNEYYQNNMFSGIEVFAVYTKKEFDKWNNYINEHNYKWINVYDPDESSDFREVYQVFYTPKLYLLDKDKLILAKSGNIMEILRFIHSR